MLQKEKVKKKNKVELMNSLIQSLVCVSEVPTCLISIGVKGNDIATLKDQREKRKNLSGDIKSTFNSWPY